MAQPPGQRGWARRDLPTEGDSAGRDAILSAARQLLEEVGYNALTVERVLHSAVVARATFYFYFRNKKHLFIEVANSVLNEMFEVAGRHYPESDEYTRIVLANVAYLRIWQREAAIICEFFAASLTDPEIHGIYDLHRRKFETRILGRLVRLQGQGRIPPLNPTLLAASLSSMVEFVAFRFFSSEGDVVKNETSFPDLVRILSGAWYQAVYGKPAPAEYDYSRRIGETSELSG